MSKTRFTIPVTVSVADNEKGDIQFRLSKGLDPYVTEWIELGEIEIELVLPEGLDEDALRIMLMDKLVDSAKNWETFAQESKSRCESRIKALSRLIYDPPVPEKSDA